MADIPINPVTRRVEFTGNTGTGPFAFTFNVLAQADVAAYKNNTLLALTSDYTVSLNSNGTGSITLTSALIATDELVIIGDLALSRTTDFVTAGDLLASSLNEQFDSNVVMSQQLDERFDRTIRSQPGDINKNLYLPLVSSRASQLLSFDSSGNITTTSLSNVPDIGTVNLTVSGVASFADGSASAPSITNIGDTNTGMYFGAADQINFSVGGSEVISVASTGTTISGLSISSGDILLTDNSATALEIKEGSNNYLTFITTNGSEKLSFGSTANPTFEVNGSFRQPLIAATTSFFSQTYSGATLSATNGSVNIESYSASKAGIVLNGSGDQITFTSPTLGFVGLVQVVGAITTNTSLNIASSTTVDGILDEDNMASNSATKLATQQSIKAYVDAQVGTVDTLAEVLGNGNTTGGTDIAVSTGDDITFADSSKAIFGAGSDLQIYHDGAHSYIQDAGLGELRIKTNGTIIQFLDNSNNYLIRATVGADVGLYHNTAQKLATTSTGVDITGTLTSDGLTVKNPSISGEQVIFKIENAANTGTIGQITYNQTDDTMAISNESTGILRFDTTAVERMRIDSSGNVGIGHVPSGNLTAGYVLRLDGGSQTYIALNNDTHTTQVTGGFVIGSDATAARITQRENQPLIFDTNDTERMRIDSSGNVGIGVSSVSGVKMDVLATASDNLVARFENSHATGSYGISVKAGDDSGNYAADFANKSGTSLMRIRGDGNVGIGTDSPQRALSIGTHGSSSSAEIAFGTTTTGNASLLFGDGTTGTALYDGYIQYQHNGGNMLFATGGGSERMRIDSSGNVGIGTDSPSAKLSVTGLAMNSASSGVELEGSWPWLKFKDTEANQDSWLQYVDASSFIIKQIDYDDRNSAPSTVGSERMRIDSSGNLLVGTTTTPALAGLAVGSTSTGKNVSIFSSSNGNNGIVAIYQSNGTQEGQIYAGSGDVNLFGTSVVKVVAATGGVKLTSGATSWVAISDERLKDVIEPITNAAQKVSTLRAVIGRYKTDTEETRRSFLIAQDVQAVLPEAVDATNENELGIRYTETIPLLVAAIQEQQATIQTLTARISALES